MHKPFAKRVVLILISDMVGNMTLHNDVLVPKCGQVYDNHFVQCHFFQFTYTKCNY